MDIGAPAPTGGTTLVFDTEAGSQLRFESQEVLRHCFVSVFDRLEAACARENARAEEEVALARRTGRPTPDTALASPRTAFRQALTKFSPPDAEMRRWICNEAMAKFPDFGASVASCATAYALIAGIKAPAPSVIRERLETYLGHLFDVAAVQPSTRSGLIFEKSGELQLVAQDAVSEALRRCMKDVPRYAVPVETRSAVSLRSSRPSGIRGTSGTGIGREVPRQGSKVATRLSPFAPSATPGAETGAALGASGGAGANDKAVRSAASAGRHRLSRGVEGAMSAVVTTADRERHGRADPFDPFRSRVTLWSRNGGQAERVAAPAGPVTTPVVPSNSGHGEEGAASTADAPNPRPVVPPASPLPDTPDGLSRAPIVTAPSRVSLRSAASRDPSLRSAASRDPSLRSATSRDPSLRSATSRASLRRPVGGGAGGGGGGGGGGVALWSLANGTMRRQAQHLPDDDRTQIGDEVGALDSITAVHARTRRSNGDTGRSGARPSTISEGDTASMSSFRGSGSRSEFTARSERASNAIPKASSVRLGEIPRM